MFRPEAESNLLVIEVVGYTAGDHSPINFRQMKAAALAHCLDGCQYVQVRSGSALVSEQDPAFMAWDFPHLDPFGIGGFNNPIRAEGSQLSFAYQLRNVLL